MRSENLGGLFEDIPVPPEEFNYRHLPVPQAALGLIFSELAETLGEVLPEGPQKNVAIRKLALARSAALTAVEA